MALIYVEVLANCKTAKESMTLIELNSFWALLEAKEEGMKALGTGELILI